MGNPERKFDTKSSFYLDLVDRQLANMMGGVGTQEMEPEVIIADVAERTMAAISITSMDVFYQMATHLSEINEEEDSRILLQEIIESIEDSCRELNAGGLEGFRTGPQVVASNIGRVYISLLRREDGDWLLKFLQSDEEFTSHIGGIPDWLQPQS